MGYLWRPIINIEDLSLCNNYVEMDNSDAQIIGITIKMHYKKNIYSPSNS